MFSGVFLLFLILACRLYSLQILNGEQYQQDLKTSIMRTLSVPASRGNIYDRYGRPLATNLVAFSVKIDDSIKIDFSQNRTQLIIDIVEKLNETDGSISDILPISKTKPYKFTINSEEELEWKQSIGLEKKQLDYSAEETLKYLEEKYKLTESKLSEDIKRKVISLSIESTDKNLMLLYLVNILTLNGETIVDDLPISKEAPYTFKFDNNASKELEWKKSVAMNQKQYSYNAEETLQYLEDLFDIPSCLSPAIKRNLVSIRYALYLERYRKYQPVTVALDINDKTVAYVEENQTVLPGVFIDTDSLRYYNYDVYFSHILGYIRKISDKEYEANKEYGYTQSDLFGKSGVEKLKELDLRGTDGKMLVEVDSLGKRINTIETTPPVSGKDVFLTLDANLQKAAYDYLEAALRDTLILKLTSSNKSDYPVTIKQLFTAMVNGNGVDMKKIYTSTEGQQFAVYQYILNNKPDFDSSNDEHIKEAKQILINGINNNDVSTRQMVLILIEQGIISADENYLNKITSGTISPLSVILDKLKSGELKPSDTKLSPCTGSVVVSDVNTGETLALVTYPSYDNNELVNNFNNEYYNSLLNDTVTTPLINRPLSEKKAPGSTLKMVSAMAGLESGYITPNTLIQDMGTFTKAGVPYAKCWINSGRGSHGKINVSTALEVSCNYFFYELAYRMGNYADGTTLQSINILNEYMDMFGLNSRTGIEIGEAEPTIASPQNKENIIKWQNPEATSTQTRWTDGETIRAAIGQSVNNYTTAHMNKYIATLANGGTRYKMHIIDKVQYSDGTLYEQVDPEIENIADFKQANLDAIYKGMLQVTSGTRGTLRHIFRDFPIKVAAKSGTAQEVLTKSSHTLFVAYAPYDEPQISVSVMIPFGEASSSPAAVVGKNIIGEYLGLNYEGTNSYLNNILAE